MSRKESLPRDPAADACKIPRGASHAALIAGLSNDKSPLDETPAPVESARSIPDDALLTRDAFAAALSEHGYPITGSTLATKASRGGGPPYRLFGRRPLYEWGPGLQWAKSRLSRSATSTSEHSIGAA